jgi:hypothetical protein
VNHKGLGSQFQNPPASCLCVIDTQFADAYLSLVNKLQTVVELPEFLRRAKAIMSDEERAAIVDMIAADPEAGVSLGGGLRKVRVGRHGSGKSGGYRMVYVFGGVQLPIFLVTVFAKNEKDNLSKAEQADLVMLSKALLERYGEPR